MGLPYSIIFLLSVVGPKLNVLRTSPPPNQVALNEVVEQKRIIEGVHDIAGDLIILFKHTHKLKTLDYSIGCFHGFKTANGINKSFEFSVIFLQNIIEIFYADEPNSVSRVPLPSIQIIVRFGNYKRRLTIEVRG